MREESGDSNRDITGLLDRGSQLSESGLWSDTLPWTADSRQNTAAVFATGGGDEGEEEFTSYGGIDVSLAHQLVTRESSRGACPS